MANPNKTVAAARRKMGGFPARERRDPAADPFMAFVFEKAREGVSYKTIEEARAAFDASQARDPRIDPRAGDVLKDENRALWKVEAISPNGVVHVRHRGRPDCFTMERWRRHAAGMRSLDS